MAHPRTSPGDIPLPPPKRTTLLRKALASSEEELTIGSSMSNSPPMGRRRWRIRISSKITTFPSRDATLARWAREPGIKGSNFLGILKRLSWSRFTRRRQHGVFALALPG